MSTPHPSPPAAPVPDPVIPAPRALAEILEAGMLAKATTPVGRMFLLSLTGGAYVALGFVFMVTSQQGMSEWPVGITKVLGGLVFSVGLGLVVISGSDLFTGTTMTSVPWLSKRISTAQLLRHWSISFLGNLTGAAAVVVMVFLGGTHGSNESAWGLVVLNITQAKVTLDWHQAFFLGILANFAVCLAVWVATAGRTVTDKVLGVAGPLALFVASGFEHSVANMFMLPMGLIIKYGAGQGFWSGQALADAGVDIDSFAAITPGAALWDNMVPVTLGNIVGGAVLVGAYFWAAYRRDDVKAEKAEKAEQAGQADQVRQTGPPTR